MFFYEFFLRFDENEGKDMKDFAVSHATRRKNHWNEI